ncbi:hypothetical protein SEEE1831_15698, partial [Salmonella enterica subsp. enterica serovar Enteritidis str. 13183-1]
KAFLYKRGFTDNKSIFAASWQHNSSAPTPPPFIAPLIKTLLTMSAKKYRPSGLIILVLFLNI